MNKFAALLAVLGSLAIVSSANAQDIKSGLVGLWKLTDHGNKNPSTGAIEHPRGEHPGGYQLFSKDGHHMFVMFDQNRKKPSGPPSNVDKVALFDSMVSYAGTYKVEVNKILIRMEHDASQHIQIDRTYVVELAGTNTTLTADPFKYAVGLRITSIRSIDRL